MQNLMDRSGFLKRMAAGAAALVVAPTAVLRAGEPETAPREDTQLLETLQDVAFPTLRYRVPVAYTAPLARTGDATKTLVVMHGQSGVRVQKVALMSGVFGAVYGGSSRNWKSELAYQIAKRAKECARDIAHHEGIDFRRNEWEWKTGMRR